MYRLTNLSENFDYLKARLDQCAIATNNGARPYSNVTSYEADSPT